MNKIFQHIYLETLAMVLKAVFKVSIVEGETTKMEKFIKKLIEVMIQSEKLMVWLLSGFEFRNSRINPGISASRPEVEA